MDIKPVRIIWHHSADSSTAHQFVKINAYHKTRDFPLSSMNFYVGYHYLVEQDGTVMQARKENEIGAHDTGENLNSIGICLAGNFDVQWPSEAQRASVCQLLGQVRKRWNIPINRIEPHRWDDDTDCPGRLLEDNWLIDEYLKREESAAVKVFQWIGKTYKLL